MSDSEPQRPPVPSTGWRGDDKLQQQARGVVVPESFTHGSSEQRVRWFSRGFESGDPQQCDTFRGDA